MKTWTKEFPKEEGDYWMYGYRYGRISCGQACEPELMFMRVRKCANGFLNVADGQFVCEKEIEDTVFQKADSPKLPDLG